MLIHEEAVVCCLFLKDQGVGRLTPLLGERGCRQAMQSSCGLCPLDPLLGPFTLCSHLPLSPSCLCFLVSLHLLLPPVELLTLWVSLSLSGSFKPPSGQPCLWAQPWRAGPSEAQRDKHCPESATAWLHPHSGFSTKMFFLKKILISYWKVVVESRKDAGILSLWRRRIQSRARDEAWSLGAFV